MSAYDMWLDPPDDEPERLEDDAEPDDYPFEAGDWRSDERCLLLERRYDQ
ncbi:hypothetical protein [Pseudomonas donghuensis]|nr:hypothetical protein [Pseudomonas donghuensis]UVL22416.1 hypothetical protein LOY30_16270 [Pseudomonas donghuensis]